jgi:AbiV family abortive infection protein
VKTAATPVLARCAISAAANAQDLLRDAEALSALGRNGRAYALTALAVEEVGKAASLITLAVMPESLRAQAPLGRMLAWHQLKLVGGMLIVLLPSGRRTVAAALRELSPDQVARMLENAEALTEDQDSLKQRGLYVDIDCSGLVRLPSEVSEAEVAAQLALGRRAVSAVGALLEQRTPAWLANPPADEIEFCRALVSAFADTGYGRTPEAAIGVLRDLVRKLREQPGALRGSKSRVASSP